MVGIDIDILFALLMCKRKCEKYNDAEIKFFINIMSKHFEWMYLQICKMFIVNISSNCRLTTYFFSFPTVATLAIQYPLVATKAWVICTHGNGSVGKDSLGCCDQSRMCLLNEIMIFTRMKPFLTWKKHSHWT